MALTVARSETRRVNLTGALRMATCFVIMPFGEKADPDGKLIDFDQIYEFIIKAGVESLKGMKCIRCDEIQESGIVHKQMIEQIYQADVAVVDITTLNPNVFYELGVRHSLTGCVTVIIKREGTNIPFNILQMKAIEYNESPKSVEDTKKKIASYIKNGLETRTVDSLVHNSLPIRIAEQAIPIHETKVYRYKLDASDCEIRLITGDLQDVTCIDVWVSSENTNMEMARYYECSISGVVRYLGAKKNRAGQVIDDTIAKLLREEVGENANVPAGTVIVTSAGELEKTHHVKRIFHAAAMFGQVGRGFRPIPDVTKCVGNAFAVISSADLKELGIRSILFPLMGTGQGGGKPEEVAHLLIKKAISCLKANQKGPLKEVYFLCWTEKDLECCRWSLRQIGLEQVD
jgi:O-acetyl-ADP-ribose deacetylase (regulator of RNase III)